MSWNDFYRRQRALQAALEHATADPDGMLGPQAVAEARGVFSDTDELLGALQYKWTQALIGQLELALNTAEEADADRVDTVASAWHRTAATHPALREVLDRHCPAEWSTYRDAVEREEQLLALWSGLADPSETEATTVRIGAAFRRLLQNPHVTPRESSAVPAPQ